MYIVSKIYSNRSRDGRYKNGNWSVEVLEAAEADIAAGATYSEATHERAISRSTLHSRSILRYYSDMYI